MNNQKFNNFHKNSRINWKYILIVVILAVIVGGGILGYIKYFEKEIISINQFPEVKKPEKIVEEGTTPPKIELSEEIINRIIGEIFPVEHKGVEHWTGDVDNDGYQEVIITSLSSIEQPQSYLDTFHFVIVTLLSSDGVYKKVIEFNFETGKTDEFFLFGHTPRVRRVEDINKDGLTEIQLVWHTGAARPITQNGFLVLDWPNQKVDWMQVRDKEGKIVPVTFYTGWSPSYGLLWRGEIYLSDIIKDGRSEIIYYQYQTETETSKGKTELTAWEVEVYQWNGSMYTYNKEFSSSSELSGQVPEWLEDILKSPQSFE